MKIEDSLYGTETIDEPVLHDLLASAAVRRLRGVLQHGVTALIGITSPTTRYEHSVGTMLLMRRLGAGLEEQIAALLHDVSHTAFSHVIDYVFDNHDDQSFHDEEKVDYVAGTDLPGILEAHGYPWKPLLDEERYSLLEQPSPALCGDRVDYFLRDARDLGLLSEDEIEQILDRLTVVDGRIGVADVETARRMAHAYLDADEASWANFREVGLYELAARAIRRGFALGLLTRADLWGTDRALWERLHASSDPELRRLLSLVDPATGFDWDEAQPTFRVSTKLRAIDPGVAVNGRLRPLSALDPDFARRRDAYLAEKSGKWPMRVVAPLPKGRNRSPLPPGEG
jgi:HD superfamily phosphohydrolase